MILNYLLDGNLVKMGVRKETWWMKPDRTTPISSQERHHQRSTEERKCEAKRFIFNLIYVLKLHALIHIHPFSVSLQPFDFDPQDKNRHKFMVQSMFAPAGEINQDSLVCSFI